MKPGWLWAYLLVDEREILRDWCLVVTDDIMAENERLRLLDELEGFLDEQADDWFMGSGLGQV